MTDKTLERDIEALLSVEAAPDFRARVRERIAAEAAPSVWRLRWAFVAASLVAAAVLGVVVLRAPSSPSSASLSSASLSSPSPSSASPPSASPPSASRRTTDYGLPTTSQYRPRPPRVETPATFEVIVDASEAAAWRRLLGGVGSGHIDRLRMARADEPRPLPVIDDFVLTPIVIEPLTPAVDEQGVRP